MRNTLKRKMQLLAAEHSAIFSFTGFYKAALDLAVSGRRPRQRKKRCRSLGLQRKRAVTSAFRGERTHRNLTFTNRLSLNLWSDSSAFLCSYFIYTKHYVLSKRSEKNPFEDETAAQLVCTLKLRST